MPAKVFAIFGPKRRSTPETVAARHSAEGSDPSTVRSCLRERFRTSFCLENMDCRVQWQRPRKFCTFLSRKLLRRTTCLVWKQGLVSPTQSSERPESAFVNCKTRGKLLHPTTNVFNLVSATDKHSESMFAYEQIWMRSWTPFISRSPAPLIRLT